MLYKAKKQGNGISVTIPRMICKILDIKEGDKLDINIEDNKIIIKKEEKHVLFE